jgi:hypothetical protein
LTAGAVTASSGQSEGATGATAVKAGTSSDAGQTGGTAKDGGTQQQPGTTPGKDTTATAGTTGSGDLKSAMDAAVKLDAVLQQASPAQKSLMIAISQRYPGRAFPISKAEWIAKIVFATTGLKDEDLKYLETFPWEEGHMSKEELRDNIQKIVAQKDGGTLAFNFGDRIKIPLSKRQISGWKMNSLALPINSQIVAGTVVRGSMLLRFEKTDETKFMLQLNNVELKCTKVTGENNSVYYFDFTKTIEVYDMSDVFIDKASGIFASNDFIDWQ